MRFTNNPLSLLSATTVLLFMLPQVHADEIVTCESHDYKYSRCSISSPGYVKLHKQLSNSQCKQGSTWDYDRHGIWVDQGCKAEFLVENDRNDDYRNNDRDDYRQDDHRGDSGEVIHGVLITRNIKRNSADYRSFNSGNLKRCARACADDNRCQSFNFGKEQKDCHLKDNVVEGVNNNTVISGVKKSAENDYRNDDHRGHSSEKMFGVHITRNIKRNSADYRSFNSGNLKQCAKACADDHRCKSFNFGKERKDCHLKDNVVKGNQNNTVISGVKNH